MTVPAYRLLITRTTGVSSHTETRHLRSDSGQPPYADFAAARSTEVSTLRTMQAAYANRGSEFALELELLDRSQTLLVSFIYADAKGQATFFEGIDTSSLEFRRLRWDMEETPDLPENLTGYGSRGGH